jgi:NitT/TauT family transport system substrate-binding protein
MPHQLVSRRTILGYLGAATATNGVLFRPAFAQTTSLNIAAVPIEVSAEPFYANDAGFFKAAGIVPTFMGGNTGPAIAAGVASGAIDIGMSNSVSLVQARGHGLPFVIVAAGSIYTAKVATDLMVVPKSSAITRGRDLTGKTVGVSVLNGIPHYASRAWIDADGGDSSATKFVEIYHPEMIAALAQGRVDAASLSEPYLTPARAANRAIGAPEDAIAPEFVLTVHFTTLAWAKANPDLLRRYVTAIAKTAQWANAHPDLVVPILAKYSKQPEDAVRTMQRATFSDTLVARQLQPVIDVTAKYGNIARFPAEEMLYR